ncbi:hypothetical protein L9F63_027263, partial [Diploptera punctata]
SIIGCLRMHEISSPFRHPLLASGLVGVVHKRGLLSLFCHYIYRIILSAIYLICKFWSAKCDKIIIWLPLSDFVYTTFLLFISLSVLNSPYKL